MTLIVFGIVALIAIVFLIVFNVRAAGQRRKKVEEAPQEVSEPQREEAPAPQQTTQRRKRDPLKMEDDAYRQALRQFQTGAKKKPTRHISDEDYREALRKMKQEE
ncbi:hypothetical protein [Brevibacillus massiliensis]|uniref:hypothetical protein n=1 Tax=Brevibacillus massiliensis TaxID=1118054 RepID=UPI00031B7061|nr:hypothetical protein [Brevibacillus massiliensis]